jgi:hypothetical protein
LSNIYLDRLDQYVEQRLLPEYNLGVRRRPNRAYQVLEYAIARARRHRDKAEARRLILRRRQIPSQDPADPGYRRLRYVRYADLCRARHKSAYAESRVMPTSSADGLVRVVCCFLMSA